MDRRCLPVWLSEDHVLWRYSLDTPIVVCLFKFGYVKIDLLLLTSDWYLIVQCVGSSVSVFARLLDNWFMHQKYISKKGFWHFTCTISIASVFLFYLGIVMVDEAKTVIYTI